MIVIKCRNHSNYPLKHLVLVASCCNSNTTLGTNHSFIYGFRRGLWATHEEEDLDALSELGEEGAFVDINYNEKISIGQ